MYSRTCMYVCVTLSYLAIYYYKRLIAIKLLTHG